MMKKRFCIFVFVFLLFFPVINAYADESSSASLTFTVGGYYPDSKGNRYYVVEAPLYGQSYWNIPDGSTATKITLKQSTFSGLSNYKVYFFDKKVTVKNGTPSEGSYLSVSTISASTMKNGTTLNIPSGTQYIYIYIYKSNTDYGSGSAMSTTVTYTSAPVPTASPTSVPSSSPAPAPSSGSGGLNDYNWRLSCYEYDFAENHTLSSPVVSRFVPFNSSNMEQHYEGTSNSAIYSQVYTYRVKIPFHFECLDFDGTGRFDAHLSFVTDVTSDFLGSSGTVQASFNYSIPWIESEDSSFSFDATAPAAGYPTGIDLHNALINSGMSPQYYYCYDVYGVYTSSNMFSNFGSNIKVSLSDFRFTITDSQIDSSRLPSKVLEDINQGVHDTNDTLKQEHQEEIDTADKAVDGVNQGVSEITDVMNSWEIVTMPVKLVGDFVTAITSDGSTGLTFPSFELMGYKLWDSYTFDLSTISEKFPVLYNSLHIVSGILVVLGFVKYCWNKWHVLTGDDKPEGQ